MTDQLQIPDDTVKFLISESHKRGMKVYLGWQFGSIDVASKTLLPMIQPGKNELDYDQVIKMLNSWQILINEKAKLYGDAGLDGLQIDFHAFFVGVNPSYSEYYKTRIIEIIDDVKKVYSGKITYGSAMPQVDTRFLGKIDFYEIPDLVGVSLRDKYPLSVIKLKQEYVNSLRQYISNVPVGIPVMVSSMVQSKSDYYDKFWTEDGFCVDSSGGMTSNRDNCVQLGYTTDFSLQAMGLEAVFQALNEVGSSRIKAVNLNTAYWLTDNLEAYPAFPNLSQSIRNKPAENDILRKFV
jgi:hypothetical protein